MELKKISAFVANALHLNLRKCREQWKVKIAHIIPRNYVWIQQRKTEKTQPIDNHWDPLLKAYLKTTELVPLISVDLHWGTTLVGGGKTSYVSWMKAFHFGQYIQSIQENHQIFFFSCYSILLSLGKDRAACKGGKEWKSCLWNLVEFNLLKVAGIINFIWIFREFNFKNAWYS